jgi:hypothetical protein
MAEFRTMEGACPVPPDQRPLEEFQQLERSWFFAWPSRGGPSLRSALVWCWLVLLPITTVVATGSVPLRHHPTRLLVAAAVAALVLPLLVLVRQWLGWSYVHRRLVSERVPYEESGWYDGQVWEKPLSWRQRDLLVARHQVRPILARLLRSMGITAALLLWGASLCQAL